VFVVLLHDNALQHTAARTGALLEHFNWELFDLPYYSLDLVLNVYHLFTLVYKKNCFGSQCFNNNEELVEVVKTWLRSQVVSFPETSIQNLYLDTSALVPALTMVRGSLSVYVIFAYNNIFFSLLVMLTAHKG
jgi:hypothetical protein